MNADTLYKYFPDLSSGQMEQFRMLGPLYAEWNARINVISRKDMDHIYTHHVLHSLALLKYMQENQLHPSSILDVGTGGGFPGIPLAIALPDCRFTLCDSIAKKIKVVTEVSSALGLRNVTPVWSRSEDLKDVRCEILVSRAVTELKKFMPLVRGLYTDRILYLKGGDLEREIAEAKLPAQNVTVTEISRFFEEDFFESKKIICIFNQKH